MKTLVALILAILALAISFPIFAFGGMLLAMQVAGMDARSSGLGFGMLAWILTWITAPFVLPWFQAWRDNRRAEREKLPRGFEVVQQGLGPQANKSKSPVDGDNGTRRR